MDVEAYAKTRKIAVQEIRNAIREEGKRWWDNYFNNFTSKLPWGSVRLRLMELRVECGEEALRQFVNDSHSQPFNSDKRRGMTYADFLLDIDTSIEDAGLDVNRILSLQSEIYIGSKAARRELLGYVFPVFVGLRAKGYNRSPDLTS
jgi:hypothetical protein